jgi:hypothetical protein
MDFFFSFPPDRNLVISLLVLQKAGKCLANGAAVIGTFET